MINGTSLHLFPGCAQKYIHTGHSLLEVRARPGSTAAYAEPDYLYFAEAVPNDPSYGLQSGLHNAAVADADIRRIFVAGQNQIGDVTLNVSAISAFNADAGAFGVGRNYNETGSVAIRVTANGGAQALLRLDIP